MIKSKFYLLSLIIPILLSSCLSQNKEQRKIDSDLLKIIFETDIGNDVDDAMALDMLYKYIDMGKIDLLSVMINKEGEYSALFTNIMNNWYGYPNIPIGIVHDGADSEHDATNYAKCVVLMKNNNNEPMFQSSQLEYAVLDEAHNLYRKILSQQPDSSVVIVSVGFSTNLARLLETSADEFSHLNGKELVAKKVKFLSTMAGCFNNSDHHEYNIVKDITAAKKVFAEWPTTIVTSPFEVGLQINYQATSIENDFAWASEHPMVEAYKCYLKMPYDRPTWDLTSVLYAVEGTSYFDVSPAGKIDVTDIGSTFFNIDENGNHYYLMTDSIQSDNIKQYFINLISKKPAKLK